MCTLSWWRRNGRCSVRFNRDERNGRPAAIPPRRLDGAPLPLLTPLDPEGGGTWICVDARGTTHCLLNFYDAAPLRPPRSPVASRGRLPPLAAAGFGESLASLFPAESLACFPPFHLLRIPRQGPIEHLCWNGSEAKAGPAHRDLGQWTTSGWNPAEVLAYRERMFRELVLVPGPTEERLDAFHRHQDPAHPAHGPWMRRADAHTHNLSRIRIDGNDIAFAYAASIRDDAEEPTAIHMPLSAACPP